MSIKVVTAIDSFKGSMSSIEAGNAVKKGILKVYSDADVQVRPIADGGEGTVEALVMGMNGRLRSIPVTGPLGDKVTCSYGILDESGTAIIEMSGAAGITLVPEGKRNPMETTTYGVGEVIRDAITNGCRNFIIGIGGSATNDGGAGMFQALGYGLLDKEGNQIPFGAKGLELIDKIDDSNVMSELSECTFKVACDVTNPLCGVQGASAVYGPQKGATPSMIMQMDKWLSRYAKLAREKYPAADPEEPGTGAAGGMGFAFGGFLGGRLESGVQLILEETNLESYIKDADIVVTGEGRLDSQSVMGKAPIGVAKLAKKYNKKVIAFAGSVSEDAAECNKAGIDAFFPIIRSVVTLDEAMMNENARENAELTAEQVFRLIDI